MSDGAMHAISSGNLEFARTAATIPVLGEYLRLGMQILHSLDNRTPEEWDGLARSIWTNTFPDLWRKRPEVHELKKYGPRRQVFDLLFAAWSYRTHALVDYVAARTPDLIDDLEFWMAYEGSVFLLEEVARAPLIIELGQVPRFGPEFDQAFEDLVLVRARWQQEAVEAGRLSKVRLRNALDWLRRWGFNIQPPSPGSLLDGADPVIGQGDTLGRDADWNCEVFLHTVPTLPLLYAMEPSFQNLVKAARLGAEESGDHSAIILAGRTLFQNRASKPKGSGKNLVIFGGWLCTFHGGDTKIIPFLLDGNGARSLKHWKNSFFDDRIPGRLYDACGHDLEVVNEVADWSVEFTYYEVQALKDQALYEMGRDKDSRPLVLPPVLEAWGEWQMLDPTIGFDPDTLGHYEPVGPRSHWLN